MVNNMNITKNQMKVLCGGRFFSVQYTKKDNTTRKICGRLGVTKHLKGDSRSRQPRKDMITVYEIGNGYRSLYLNQIKELKFGGNILK